VEESEVGQLEGGAGEGEQGARVAEGGGLAGVLSSCGEDAHEAFPEAVGQRAFLGSKNTVEVRDEGMGERGHGREEEVSGSERMDVADPCPQPTMGLQDIGAGDDALQVELRPTGLGGAEGELAWGLEVGFLGRGGGSGFFRQW
jgi:hypothetical protein